MAMHTFSDQCLPLRFLINSVISLMISANTSPTITETNLIQGCDQIQDTTNTKSKMCKSNVNVTPSQA